MATFRPARQRYDKQGRKHERSPRKNPPNDDFFVFSHGDLSPRHTKVRDSPCVAFSATICLIFAWRGERPPCKNPTKSPFGGFSRGDLLRFRPENTCIRHGMNQPPYLSVQFPHQRCQRSCKTNIYSMLRFQCAPTHTLCANAKYKDVYYVIENLKSW